MDRFFNKCRACLERQGTEPLNKTHKKLSINVCAMFQYCTSVEINIENDNLPNRICNKCLINIVDFYEYKKKVIENDIKLKEMRFQQEYTKNVNVGNKHLPQLESKIKPTPDENCAITTLINTEKVDTKTTGVCKTISEEIIEEFNHTQNKNELLETNRQCHFCGKLFDGCSNLTQHLRTHTGQRPFHCDVCNKGFTRKEHLVKHQMIHTGEKPYKCTSCSKSFIQRGALKVHIRVHSGEKPHVCDVCGKTFRQASTLAYHKRTHTGEMPHVCRICDKSFAIPGNLRVHMRFHTDERNHHCNVCGMSFVTSTHLTTHMRKHTGEKRHICPVCGKGFARSQHLKGHAVVHTGEQSFQCHLCHKKYNQSSHLRRHLKTHGIQIEKPRFIHEKALE